MSHLRAIERRSPGAALPEAFPFSVPAIGALEALDLSAAATFFVGENGSGKSTLLEGIAAAAALPTVGDAEVGADPRLAAQRRLQDEFRLVWSRRTRRGFFLRAEDLAGFARRVANTRDELAARLRETEAEYGPQASYAKTLAQGPLRGSLGDIARRYGAGVDARSHGETFLEIFRQRLVPGGLYLLDEPEAALSPQSQLGLLALLLERARDGCQFIIATHSPMLLALPGAAIYSFDQTPPTRVGYAELEHVRLTRDFLADPERFLRHLGTA